MKKEEPHYKSLLYPAMQKFYSALNSLDKFNKEKNFFENISSLDTFFSEFRNITFVLQKSLSHTEYKSIYKELCSKHLSDCKWFIEKRNETTKQQPFQLTKEIKLTIYLPDQSINVSTKRFTVENDVDISTLTEQFKQLFTEINPIEVFFSAEFTFYESDNSFDIYDEIIRGIIKMKYFLEDMKSQLKENCNLCDEIEKEIKKLHFSIFPRDMFFITDYVYYPQKDKFEKALRFTMQHIDGNKSTLPRMPLNVFYNGPVKDIGDTIFEKFVMLHVIIGSSDLMPTRMIIYRDNTFELDSFHSDIKTTIYRKINETANKIANEDVKEVFWMQTYLIYPSFSNMLTTPANERGKTAEKEFLTFMKVDNSLNEAELVFDGAHLKCVHHIAKQLKHPDSKKLNFGRYNMMPILKAFKEKQEASQ